MRQDQGTQQRVVRGPGAGERGASAVEYALFLALVAAVILATVATLGLDVLDLFDSAAGTF
jgi:Flp pilus assembly pilin Flp